MDKLEWQDLASQLGLEYDEDTKIIFGQKDGYTLFIEDAGEKIYRICFAVKGDEALSIAEDLKELKKSTKGMTNAQLTRYKLVVTVKGGMTKGRTKETIAECLEASVTFLKEHGLINVCEHTGEAEPTAVYQVGTNLLILSADSFQQLSSNLAIENQSYDQQNENVIGGIVGAFVGCLIGGAVTLGIAQLGYVSFVSGLVMGVCTIKGYELLGKKLSKLGIGISIFFMLVMILFVHQLDWAILVTKEVGTDVFTAFSYFTNYLLSGGEVHYTYWLNLGLLYLFTGIGAYSMVHNALGNHTLKYVTRKL